MLKKIAKWLLIILLVLLVGGFLLTKILSEDIPDAVPNTDADAIANKMLDALNKPAWDSLAYLKWEFIGGHRYLWDKQANHAVISWGKNQVVMDLDEVSGVAYVDGKQVEDSSSLVQKAWAMWCNDSFWMFAPYKVFDPGTTRSIVQAPEGSTGLLVSYDSGGVTPGDQYLWLLGSDYIPTSYKMWVSILPLKGMEVSWEGWQTMDGGAKLATLHKSPLLSFGLSDVEASTSIAALDYSPDIFDVL